MLELDGYSMTIAERFWVWDEADEDVTLGLNSLRKYALLSYMESGNQNFQELDRSEMDSSGLDIPEFNFPRISKISSVIFDKLIDDIVSDVAIQLL